MFARLAEASISLDIGTLFVIATCVTSLLGLFLLFAWMQDRIQALAWWGMAYLIGGFSARSGGSAMPWSRRRCRRASPTSFVHRRRHDLERRAPISRPAGALGRHVLRRRGLAGRMHVTGIHALSPASRIILSSIIVATYTFLIAAELWRERRKSLIRRWPALFVPMLHGAIFLLPVALASLGDAQPRHRLDRGIRHRDRALCGRRRLYRAGPGQGPHRASLQNGGRDRSP